MRFSIKDFFSKCDQILNGKLHFLCSGFRNVSECNRKIIFLKLKLFFSIIVVTYEIYLVTGDKLGAGTNSEVKITLFGEYGDTGERPLTKSKLNQTPFQRHQVDIFRWFLEVF